MLQTYMLLLLLLLLPLLASCYLRTTYKSLALLPHRLLGSTLEPPISNLWDQLDSCYPKSKAGPAKSTLASPPKSTQRTLDASSKDAQKHLVFGLALDWLNHPSPNHSSDPNCIAPLAQLLLSHCTVAVLRSDFCVHLSSRCRAELLRCFFPFSAFCSVSVPLLLSQRR
ncbi:hypothetical protein V8C37DRAFT_385222 [Trichoderma ceciliae]